LLRPLGPKEGIGMGISVSGLSSGIDTDSLIEQLVELETTNKITPVEEKIEGYDVKISAYSQLKSLIATLLSKTKELSDLDDFDIFTVQSSDEECATISGTTGCVAGEYALQVNHTATREKLISSDKLVTSQTAALSSFGIEAGTISIDGTELIIDADDTIQDLRAKINNAVDKDGDRIGVTASVIKVADSNYRLVLTAQDSGDDGVSYADVSGSVLSGLGIITSAGGDTGITYQSLASVDSIQSAIEGLAAGQSIAISGKDHDGNEISFNYTASGNNNGEEFLSELQSAFCGSVEARFNDDGTLSVTDKIGGPSAQTLSFGSFAGSVVPAMELLTVGDKGGNVLSCGSNAYFSIDGIALESESNDTEGFIPGATVHLLMASADEEVTLSIDKDIDGVKEKIQALVDAYNEIYNYIKTNTAYATEDDEEDGDLYGDMTTSTITSKLSHAFRGQFSSASGAYKTLLSIGISTDYQTGNFSIDDTKLTKALEQHFNDVVSLFATSGSSTNTSVTFGKSSSDTQSGTYEVGLTGDGSAYRIRKSGSSEWYISTSWKGDVVGFSDGPAAGLYLTINSDAMQAGETVDFTYSKGFGDTLRDTLDSLTDSEDGLITLRQKSLQKSKDYANDRLDMLNDQIEKYRERLVSQYTAMEQMMSTLNSQTTYIESLSSS
jgi:flagellar capping protein FliD